MLINVLNRLFLPAMILTVLTFQNCGHYESSGSRTDFIAQSSVFDSSSSRVGSSVEPEILPRIPKDEPLTLTPITVCSNSYTSFSGGNVIATDDLEMIFIDSTGNKACTYNDRNWLKTLRELRLLRIENLAQNCPGLTEGEYDLQIKGSTTENLLQSSHAKDYLNRVAGDTIVQKPYRVKTQKNEDGLLVAVPADQVSGERPAVLYRHNDSASYRPYSDDVDNYGCNYTVSPLLIRVTKADRTPHPLRLTSPKDGTLFDILGENSFPFAHDEKRISWFTESTVTQDYFLVLPNAQGQVRGANELFGNNTRGPDGAFAENGYLALAKYDGRKADGQFDKAARDGRISGRDEIFPQLKLWSDENRDGVAQKRELSSLVEKGIDSIDLDYDAHYLETDRYGNETRFKSVAHSSDGRMHLVFDLWFVISEKALKAEETAQIGQ